MPSNVHSSDDVTMEAGRPRSKTCPLDRLHRGARAARAHTQRVRPSSDFLITRSGGPVNGSLTNYPELTVSLRQLYLIHTT